MPCEMPVEITIETPLHVRAPVGTTETIRHRCPVTGGVPLPAGACYDPRHIGVLDSAGYSLPLQLQVLDLWPDGSIRWFLIDLMSECPTAHRLVVFARPRTAHEPDRFLRIVGGANDWVIDTAGATFHVAPRGDCLFEVRRPPSEGRPTRVRVAALDNDGRPCRVTFASAEPVADGSTRATIRVDGTVELSGAILTLEARLHFFTGMAAARVELMVRNPRRALHRGGHWDLGDPGSVFFRDLSLIVELPDVPARVTCLPEPGAGHVELCPPAVLYQDSSGGQNWRSRAHANRHGRIPLRFPGYRLDASGVAREGRRAVPIMQVDYAGGSVGATIRHFWQTFPKALEVDGRMLSARLFPRQFDDLHELQGGEQKTHVVGLAFGACAADTDGDLASMIEPPVLSFDPAWYARADAVPYLTPLNESTESGYEALVSSAVQGDDSLESKRERADEYGWRHFGDLHADHEAVGHTAEEPFVSHYNNQYDAVAGFAIQFMRSSDLRWWSAFEQLAGHVIDIDLYHTTDDKAAYNGGMFWHTAHHTHAGLSTHRTYPGVPGSASGGPSNEHNYSKGLLLHYYLTGNTASRNAVVQLADWVLAMDEGPLTVFRWLSRGATGLASSTVTPRYHGPGRGAGNSIATLLDAFRLTGSRRYIDKAESLIHRCIHPADDIDVLELLDAERRWSYTVFLQVLGRYLDEKQLRGEIDAAFSYARASMLRYARWMALREYPYLEKPEILEFPTETWAAQDMRKSEVLNLAARHMPAAERATLRERSRHFFKTSVDTLLGSPTRTLTRPLVLILSNGHTYSALSRGDPVSVHIPDFDFGKPARFIPQKEVAIRRVRTIAAGLAVALAGAFVWFVRFGRWQLW